MSGDMSGARHMSGALSRKHRLHPMSIDMSLTHLGAAGDDEDEDEAWDGDSSSGDDGGM